MGNGEKFRCVLTFLPARSTCSISTPRNDFYELNDIRKAAALARNLTKAMSSI
jgi:hypothetical protein